MPDNRPAPLVPSYVDLRDAPLPRDLFVAMAVLELGMDMDDAIKLVNETCDRQEGKRHRSSRKGRL